MNTRHLITLLILALFSTGVASAQNLDAIRAEMAKRLPQVENLWRQGLVGENNEGYLSARGQLSEEQKKLIDAENTDRRQVYAAIARSTGSNPDAVGKQRAIQIATRAASGLWLQNERGDWYKK